jgi:hypothetical protein
MKDRRLSTLDVAGSIPFSRSSFKSLAPLAREQFPLIPKQRRLDIAYGLSLNNGNQYVLQGPGWISSEYTSMRRKNKRLPVA